jgi:hypothetical protein
MSRFDDLTLKSSLKQPAGVKVDKDRTNTSNATPGEDLTDNMEEETRISAEYLEAYLKAGDFLHIDLNCGLLFSCDTNASRRYLHITCLRKATPYRIIRPQFCRQVLRPGTFTQLLHKLKCTPDSIPREKFPFGSEEIRYHVKLAFTADSDGNKSDFINEIVQLMGFIRGKCILSKNEVLCMNRKRELPVIAWGLLPKKSEIPGEVNLETGCIGNCDMTLFSNEKPFAVFEFKNLKHSISYTKSWYTLNNTWVLQLFNSFVGSNAAIAGVLCPEGFFLIWREEIESEKFVDGEEGLKTYKYYSLDPFRLIQVTDQNVEQLADFFVELVRICSTIQLFPREKLSARPSQCSPRNSSEIPLREGVKRSSIMLADGLGVLPVGSLNPSEFFSEEELAKMAEDENQRLREENEWIEVDSEELYESI